VNKFSAEDKCPSICAGNVFGQWNSEHPTQLNHLVRQHKNSKTCTNDDLSTRANSHDKIFYDKRNWHASLIRKDIFLSRENLAKFSYLHEQIRFTIENLPVCIGL